MYLGYASGKFRLQEDILTVVVWWTIPGSRVAWEWRPAESLLVEGGLVREDGDRCYLVPTAIKPHRWPERREPTGQPLAEMTAFFGMEANIRPTDMAITWIGSDVAVRWDRRTDRWTRRRVGGRQDYRYLYGAVDLAPAPAPRSVEEAGATALELLGP